MSALVGKLEEHAVGERLEDGRPSVCGPWANLDSQLDNVELLDVTIRSHVPQDTAVRVRPERRISSATSCSVGPGRRSVRGREGMERCYDAWPCRGQSDAARYSRSW